MFIREKMTTIILVVIIFSSRDGTSREFLAGCEFNASSRGDKSASMRKMHVRHFDSVFFIYFSNDCALRSSFYAEQRRTIYYGLIDSESLLSRAFHFFRRFFLCIRENWKKKIIIKFEQEITREIFRENLQEMRSWANR